jgi:hypothetical protein
MLAFSKSKLCTKTLPLFNFQTTEAMSIETTTRTKDAPGTLRLDNVTAN